MALLWGRHGSVSLHILVPVLFTFATLVRD